MAGSSTLVRTAPFQGVEAGSNPAPATQFGKKLEDPVNVLEQYWLVAQLVRASP